MKERKNITEFLIHLIIWITSYLFFILIVKTIGPFKRVDHTLLMPVTFGTFINLILVYVTSLVLIPRFSENKRAGEFILVLITLLSLLTFAETLTDKAFFRYYYSDREESFKAQLVLNFILNFFILALALGYGFTKNWFKTEKVRQELLRDKLSAELNLLKSQLNPHFLFNVLNMAFSSANRSGDQRTADIIEKISVLMRYSTYESNIEKIDLVKEIEYLQNYVDLQKMRFSSDVPVKVDFRVNGDISGCRITPLILIQFVENAFKHGVKLDQESKIDISINIDDRHLEFITRNPVFDSPAETIRKKAGIGIDNVRKRLSILYPGNHDLQIEKTDGIFVVRLIMNL